MLAVVQESDLDRGTASVAPDTMRTCALTREVKPVTDLLRFVLGPAGDVVPDIKRKLPGRGLWITATRTALKDAAARNVFGRGFRRDVKVAPELADHTEALIERAALESLAITRKAGLVIAGYAKVEATLIKKGLRALLHASDAGREGRRKLDALRRKTGEIGPEIAIIDDFSGTQLDLALSRPNVVHAALLARPGSETFLARVERLRRFRTGFSPDAVSAHAPTDGA